VAEVVGRVNDLMAASTDAHMFATFVYAVLDADGAGLTMTNAGHEPPILCRAHGGIERLTDGGLVLGMLPDQDYSQARVDLAPGDVLVFFSDGITEAMGPVEGNVARATADDGSEGDERKGAGGNLPVPEDEAFDPDEDDVNFFGEERLIDVILAHATAGAAEIRDAILSAVSAHTRGIPQSDDITLVVLKRV
jgi:sigma-B regulation protein RsbU (phosphoserine phosphatase)